MKRISSKRAKALAITKAVKDKVWERDDHCCVWCGSRDANPEAHFIPRSRGGLGIEENILTLCRLCHDAFDNGTAEQRQRMRHNLRIYLQSIYPDWDENNLIYRKE